MEIDIRKSEAAKVRIIVFSDKNPHEKDAYLLILDGEFTKIKSGYGEENYVYINTEEDAENLIKALRKAIELGNWSK